MAMLASLALRLVSDVEFPRRTRSDQEMTPSSPLVTSSSPYTTIALRWGRQDRISKTWSISKRSKKMYHLLKLIKITDDHDIGLAVLSDVLAGSRAVGLVDATTEPPGVDGRQGAGEE